MPQTDKTLHYRLTNEEWLRAVHELTESQKDVLYYLRTLDPFGDRNLDIGVREMAATLKINPSTVSRALKALDSKGYITLEITQARVKLNSKVLLQDNSVASEQQCCVRTTVLRQNNEVDRHATKSIATQQGRSPRNTQPLEPAQEGGYETPHTIQTYLNSSHSLERGGKFLDFEKEKEQEQIEISHQVEALQKNFSSQVLDPGLDQCSAQISTQKENYKIGVSSVERVEQRFKNTDLPPWRISREINGGINENFIEFIRRWLGSIPPERDRSRGDAIAYIRKQESSGDLSVLEARAQEWELQEFKRSRGAPSVAEPVDYSDVLAGIEAHLLRLDWSVAAAISAMVDHCGWRCSPGQSLSQLAGWELEEVAGYLEALQ
jgi:hypothetical protein